MNPLDCLLQRFMKTQEHDGNLVKMSRKEYPLTVELAVIVFFFLRVLTSFSLLLWSQRIAILPFISLGNTGIRGSFGSRLRDLFLLPFPHHLTFLKREKIASLHS